MESASTGEDAVTGTSAGESTVTYYTRSTAEDTVSVTASEQAALAAEVRFADQPGPYALYVTPRVEAENLADVYKRQVRGRAGLRRSLRRR